MVFESITYPSYAKINLFLHIIGKRKDAYHNLQTWFQFIDLKDFIQFKTRDDTDIKLSSNIVITDIHHNLVYKAAQLLKPYAQKYLGLEIHIDKHIPIGAGLGGGSSNAATTLIALNKLWNCNLSNEKLRTIGQKLGADVPIFVYQKAAWAEGIGEILTAKDYIKQYALVIKPNFHAKTMTFFHHPDLNKHKAPLNKSIVTDPLPHENVFLDVIIKIHPKFYDELKKLPNADALRLTGTGACFYLLSKDYNLLLQNQKKLKKDVDSWIVKTLNFCS